MNMREATEFKSPLNQLIHLSKHKIQLIEVTVQICSVALHRRKHKNGQSAPSNGRMIVGHISRHRGPLAGVGQIGSVTLMLLAALI